MRFVAGFRKRFFRAVASFVALAIVVAAAYWLFSDRLPGAVRHPMVVWRLMRSEPPISLPVPVAGVAPAELTDTWNAPRPNDRLHQGIDIFAPRGREVLSTTRGIVLGLGENRLGGRVVRVLGPGGQWHYYAHLDRYGAIRAGDIVGPGTVIGYVGNTGNARTTPPHLHYGIYRRTGGALNPYPLLTGGRER